MPRAFRYVLLSFALAMLAPPLGATLGAQERAARPLGAPVAELEEPWSGPLQLVELRGGAVVLFDFKERRLAVADFRTQEVRDVSREGSGPTEFRMVTGMWRMPGDSVQAMDMLQSRILVLDPSGTPRYTKPLSGAGDPIAMMNRPMTREVDARGRWYGEQRAFSLEGGQLKFSDSAMVVRTDPATMRADTITRIPSFQTAPQMSADVIRLPVPGFPAFDGWAVFPDGRVLVVRGADYVPELFFPNGTSRRAAALAYPKLPVTAADRKKMMDDMKRAMDESMAMGRSLAGGAPMPKVELMEPDPWQAQRPPLTEAHIRVDSRGRAWVPVIDRTHADGQRYDLLDNTGKLVDAVKFPKGVGLLGFGDGVVYTTRKDEDDLVYVRRHALP
jgi:hypothetical protein